MPVDEIRYLLRTDLNFYSSIPLIANRHKFANDDGYTITFRSIIQHLSKYPLTGTLTGHRYISGDSQNKLLTGALPINKSI